MPTRKREAISGSIGPCIQPRLRTVSEPIQGGGDVLPCVRSPGHGGPARDGSLVHGVLVVRHVRHVDVRPRGTAGRGRRPNNSAGQRVRHAGPNGPRARRGALRPGRRGGDVHGGGDGRAGGAGGGTVHGDGPLTAPGDRAVGRRQGSGTRCLSGTRGGPTTRAASLGASTQPPALPPATLRIPQRPPGIRPEEGHRNREVQNTRPRILYSVIRARLLLNAEYAAAYYLFLFSLTEPSFETFTSRQIRASHVPNQSTGCVANRVTEASVAHCDRRHFTPVVGPEDWIRTPSGVESHVRRRSAQARVALLPP